MEQQHCCTSLVMKLEIMSVIKYQNQLAKTLSQKTKHIKHHGYESGKLPSFDFKIHVLEALIANFNIIDNLKSPLTKIDQNS